MVIRLLSSLFLGTFIVLAQIGLATALPAWAGRVEPVLVALVFILVLRGSRAAFGWAVGLGAMLDLFSFLPAGTLTVALIAAVAASSVLLERYFTNRSLYSFLALTVAATAANWAAVTLLAVAYRQLDWYDGGFRPEASMAAALLVAIAANAVLTAAVYSIAQRLTDVLRPVFLQR